MMDFDEITKILEMMKEHELSEFELERDNFKLRIRKHGGGHWWLRRRTHSRSMGRPRRRPCPAAPHRLQPPQPPCWLPWMRNWSWRS
jgi:hypothetical protein